MELYESDEKQRRLEFLRNTLLLLRSRKRNLQVLCDTLDKLNMIPVGASVQDDLKDQISLIHEEVCKMKIVNEVLSNFKTNLSITENSGNDFKMQVFSSVILIFKLTSSLLKIELDEPALADLKLQFLKATEIYKERFVEKRVAIESLLQPITFSQSASCERFLEKINTTRIMTQMLIAAFCRDENTCRHLQDFRNSVRRDLTVEDFVSSWNIGF